MPTIILKIFLGFVFLTAMAQFTIALSYQEVAIPITGQSLGVLVIACLLGAKNGGLTILLYLLIGGMGLPVFANGGSGWEVFTKSSGGFLYGFLVAGYLTGWLSERWGIGGFMKNVTMMAIGTAIILLFGIGHLTGKYGVEKALEYGFYPFWPGAIIKIGLGAILVSIWHRFFSKI